MNTPQVLEYGHWPSELSAASLFSASESISCLRASAHGMYFLLSMPEEGNALALMFLPVQGDQTPSRPTRISPRGFNVRSQVHEYGGFPYAFDDHSVYFCNFSDQRIYRQAFDPFLQINGEQIGGRQSTDAPIAMTPASPGDSRPLRYADMIVDARRQRLLCVREDHRDTNAEPANTLVAVPFTGEHEGLELFADSDFVTSPCLSPDGNRLAFQTWSHPNMPWDDTQIQVAEVSDDGSLRNCRQMCPEQPGSLLQPAFSPTGDLYFIADWSNWWNLYRIRASALQTSVAPAHADRLLEIDAEMCGPQWQSGQRSYDFLDADTVLLTLHNQSHWSLVKLNVTDRSTRTLHSAFGQLENLSCHAGQAVFLASTATSAVAIHGIQRDAPNAPITTVFKGRSGVTLPPTDISTAEHFSYRTANGETAFGLYYPPLNSACQAPLDSLPPLLVSIHGGPTSSAKAAFNPTLQFWTSRGFAWLDVNHRGSTGYGRRFRQSLYGQWGVADVEDIIGAVESLIANGRVAADKVAIRGGSAGGYAVLAAMVQSDLFRAGASYYGISDLELLAQDTHKFESRYLDQLIGPYPAAVDLYRQRSPLHSIARITAPVLLLQGRLDKVVPPNQAEAIFTQLQQQNPLSQCVYFDDEGHGFRKPRNQIAALEAELAFYEKVLL